MMESYGAVMNYKHFFRLRFVLPRVAPAIYQYSTSMYYIVLKCIGSRTRGGERGRGRREEGGE